MAPRALTPVSLEPASSGNSLLARLTHEDARERIAACAEVVDDAAAVVYIDGLADALGDTDARVGRAASDALVALSRQHDIQSATKRQLHGDDASGRWLAAFTLSRTAPPELGLLPAAIEAFGAPNGDVRWAAARLVVDLGRLHHDVLPIALALAAPAPGSGQHTVPEMRRMALFCLRELAPDEPAVVDAVLRCLRESTSQTADAVELRRAALTCSPALTGPPQERLALRQALETCHSSDSDEACRELAGMALAAWARRDSELAPNET